MTVEEIRTARNTPPRFGMMTMNERGDEIRLALVRTYALRGLEPDPGELDGPVEELEYKLSHAYSNMTAAEFRLVLEGGVIGEFGADRRLVVANIFGWLYAYANGELRKSVIAEDARTSITTSRPLSFVEVMERNEAAGRNGALRLFQETKETGNFEVTCTGYAAMVYDYLVSRGKMNPKPETIRRAYLGVTTHTRRKRLDFDAAIASPDELLDYETKRELLFLYYKGLIARGGTLSL